ncbi:uncharacterized protein V6R79_016703 [Siganus canaliculatus]
MAYPRGWRTIREAYEEHFSDVDTREVTVHRVVNFVEKRNPPPWPLNDYDRGHNDDQWYDDPRNYQEPRECYGEGGHPQNDRRHFDDNTNFRRNSSPPRNDMFYSQQYHSRRDSRHQLGPRNRGRGPYNRNRGRGSGPVRETRDDHKPSPPVKRDRSPGGRETQSAARSGSNVSNRSFSPDRDKGYNHQPATKKNKPNALPSHTSSNSADGSPHSTGASKEKPPASVAETEEVVAASMEPKLTPEEDFKARRSEAIKAKALEIEKNYRQDCETFCTVVKMLVAKEPSLDNLLQAPLDKNLLEMKQRCLDALKDFVKELDETSTQEEDVPNGEGPSAPSAIHVQIDKDFPKPSSTVPTDTEGEKPAGNTGDSTPFPAGNQGGGVKQSQNIEDQIKTDENCSEPAPKGPSEDFSKCLQLYNQKGEKFSIMKLSLPKNWKDITYARPGWVPNHLPFFKPGGQYWKLKAKSTIVSASTSKYTGSCPDGRLSCGVTCYNHAEGPWCEIQSENGTRVCVLAVPPAVARVPR